jgi:hypothetical protein
VIEVRGGDELFKLAKALKEAGNKDLQQELSKGINRAMRPVKSAVRTSADSLPQRGGLAARVKASRLSTRRPNRTKGLRLVAQNNLSLWHLDQGQVRHRTANGWGETQPIRPGWWTRPTEGAAPEVRREILAAMDEVARKIDRSA